MTIGMADPRVATMTKRLVISAAVTAWVALGWAGSARAERPRVAVVGVAGDTASPELRERMSRAITDGLVASGADVVTSPGTVAYRVRGVVEVEGRTYIVRLEMLDGDSGAVVEGREDRCEICTESEALETVGLAASALKAQVFKRRPAVAVNAMPVDIGGTITVPAVAQTPPAGPSDEPDVPRAHPHRALGVAGIVTGLATAAVGGWLLSINHHQACDMPELYVGDQCPQIYSTAAGGSAALVAGGLLLTAGILAVAGVF